MPRSRREDYTEATRRALVDSAAEAFVDRGFADASLDEIARAARLTKGALYHHFAGKQEALPVELLTGFRVDSVS